MRARQWASAKVALHFWHKDSVSVSALNGSPLGWNRQTRSNSNVSTPRTLRTEDQSRSDQHLAHGIARGKDKLAQRDFFLDVLNVSATRRDAKQYLSRFKSPVEPKPKHSAAVQKAIQGRHERQTHDQWRLNRTGVNLGGLYEPTRAVAATPTFVQQVRQEQLSQQPAEIIHVALVSIRAAEQINDDTLNGIALTLSQLVRLDMQIVLAFSCADENVSTTNFRQVYRQQADRIIAAFEEHNNAGARYVDGALSVSQVTQSYESHVQTKGAVHVEIPKLIVEPLRRNAIPVVPAIAHTEEFRAVPADPADVMLGLTRALSGIAEESLVNEKPQLSLHDLPSANTFLDRIIIFDPLGGLPSEQREDGAHVFVNLDQEYQDIERELRKAKLTTSDAARQHMKNLRTLRRCLALLPPESSALLISPEEAASSSQPSARDSDSFGISTRRQKNPLIHNLLTNKPVISSSLPVARLASPGPSPPAVQHTNANRSTLVKRGMPVTIVPDPRQSPWTPPHPGQSTISLENHPDIHFPRLLALIEDSFRRPLDVQHYLDRIRGRIAGVIIAGEYEGGAILTWEAPPSPSPSATPPADPTRLVPYLDKFAVLQRSQGSSGVADIVFQAMVRTCFPSGVCWRSRKDNPVNKWYFERSRGTWQLHDTQWTMFWTTDGLVQDSARWEDYIAVCRNVEPSWADSKKPD